MSITASNDNAIHQAPQQAQGGAVLPVYRRCNITISRGEGGYLFSPEGKRYLDFAAGIAVNALGHCHPHVVEALKSQADVLWHCSNMYQVPGLTRMAERLVSVSFADKVFFCNSGGEAVECGLKMVRKYFATDPPSLTLPHKGGGDKKKRYRVITMEGGFHGRTLACISAGGNDIARKGYEPLMDGFDCVPFNNLEAVEAAIGAETAAILVEPIQGEGGVNVATHEFLQGLRHLADRHGLLLFMDEVQCGMGRTGALFVHAQAGVKPDIVSVAKGIGNGFPLAACLATDAAAAGMTPGSHGSTYGSNPLAMAVGNAVLDVMLAPGFFEHVTRIGNYLKVELEKLVRRFPQAFVEVRGSGLILGLQMRGRHYEFVDKLRASGLLTTPAEHQVIRIVPPLIIEQSHVDEAVQILHAVAEGWR